MKQIKDFIEALNSISKKMNSPAIIDLLKYEDEGNVNYIKIINRSDNNQYEIKISKSLEDIFILKNEINLLRIAAPEIFVIHRLIDYMIENYINKKE